MKKPKNYTKEVPKEDGWYWVRYTDKHRRWIIVPAEVWNTTMNGKNIAVIKTAKGDFFASNANGVVKYMGRTANVLFCQKRIPKPPF